jgi:hypothetical protein
MYIVRVTRSRKMRWARHVAHVKEMRIVWKYLFGNLKRGEYLKDVGVAGLVVLNEY